MQSINVATKERAEAVRIYDIWKRCESWVAQGNKIHVDDQPNWDRDAEDVKSAVDNEEAKLRSLPSERLKLQDALQKNEANLKKFVMHNMQSSFVFEQGGSYFQVSLGASKLRQPKHKNLDYLGIELRNIVTDEDTVRSLKFKDVSTFIRTYTEAAGHMHSDYHNLTRIKLELMNNPRMSRYACLNFIKSICDLSLQTDMVALVNRLILDPEAKKDLSNSVDPATSNEQLVNQKRAPFMTKKNYQETLTKYASEMTAEQKKEYGYIEPKRQRSRQRQRNRNGRGRGGARSHWGGGS
ncbi:Oidioi.mRNA.OKI2018_I69.YSR.g17113.t1.cds [Oikopleura dioica]|uniref:Oidioi.mRNA.OKI2018_I69.YSR.g17113.t1.cds n=1 Tax=Oikopleura dioica TaxID=34765 RepID=A0ABN7SMV2_OIKDI|nr:Oidioi.mRNA.OKI2018_I69.YSR.g17113.t1.cds [Oikopleura dioica]